MQIDRRAFTRAVSAATAGLMLAGRAAAQAAALKDLVPKGWLIGVAINQNQSDGSDREAVDLVTRQFNSITPENLLKFQSVQPRPAGSRSTRRTVMSPSASTAAWW
jgi:GH35 family endo-1,4-beta-xylanase